MKTLGRIIGTTIVLSLGAIVLLTSRPDIAEAGSIACGTGTHGSEGYAYAGHQSREVAHGVRATITSTVQPVVRAGHVAGWVGVGGPGQGANGETAWVQIGLAALPNTPTMVYAEITRPGQDPSFVPLVENVKVGESHRVAVLEMGNRKDAWRVWLDGKPATDPIVLPGSSARWKPIVTAESYNDRQDVCNVFGFRFEAVDVAAGPGGSWRTFRAGYQFLDRGYALTPLRPAKGGVRTLSSDTIQAYAFDAASA